MCVNQRQSNYVSKKTGLITFFYRFTGDLNNGETSISSSTSPEPVNFDDKRTNDEFKNEALEEKSDDTEDNISENIKYVHLKKKKLVKAKHSDGTSALASSKNA